MKKIIYFLSIFKSQILIIISLASCLIFFNCIKNNNNQTELPVHNFNRETGKINMDVITNTIILTDSSVFLPSVKRLDKPKFELLESASIAQNDIISNDKIIFHKGDTLSVKIDTIWINGETIYNTEFLIKKDGIYAKSKNKIDSFNICLYYIDKVVYVAIFDTYHNAECIELKSLGKYNDQYLYYASYDKFSKGHISDLLYASFIYNSNENSPEYYLSENVEFCKDDFFKYFKKIKRYLQ